jgi:methionyl aminopeptidase
MSLIKTPDEIQALREGGAILSRALQAAMKVCVAEAETKDIDAEARRVIEEAGARPSFIGYRTAPTDPAFPSTLCISINDEVVHGPATPSRVVQEGDIVGLDIGAWYKGLATDMATTVIVGNVPQKTRELVQDTRESLVRGISAIRAGGMIMDIGGAVEDYLKPKNTASCVTWLVMVSVMRSMRSHRFRIFAIVARRIFVCKRAWCWRLSQW